MMILRWIRLRLCPLDKSPEWLAFDGRITADEYLAMFGIPKK